MLDFFNYSIEQVYAFSLAFIRLSGLCVVAPFFGGDQVPKQIRILFALVVTFVIFPTLSVQITQLPRTPFEYLIIVGKELCIGMLIGFLATAIFFGFQMGGRFVSIHAGLAMARMLDPFTSEQASVIGQLFALITITVFLIINGHHLLLQAIYMSFAKIPLVEFSFKPHIFAHAMRAFNIIITTAIKVAAPTMAALFAINLIFAFIARLVPRMNVFILSLPAKIAVAVIIVMITLPAIMLLLGDVIGTVMRDTYTIMNMF